MNKNFLMVLHEGEIMDATSLDMLKGGAAASGCGSLQNCGCYKAANQSCGARNQNAPKPIEKPKLPEPTKSETIIVATP